MPCCAARKFALLLNASPIPVLPVKRGYHHHPLFLTAGSPLGRISSFHPQILHFMEKINPKLKCFLGKRALTKRRLHFWHHLVLSSSPHEWANESCSVTFDSLRPHRLYSPWNSPGQNTGVGSLSFLQGIFPTQGWNPGLPHCGQILYQLSHQGKPKKLEWVAYPFSSGSSWPRNQTGVSCIAGGFFSNRATREAHINKGKKVAVFFRVSESVSLSVMSASLWLPGL